MIEVPMATELIHTASNFNLIDLFHREGFMWWPLLAGAILVAAAILDSGVFDRFRLRPPLDSPSEMDRVLGNAARKPETQLPLRFSAAVLRHAKEVRDLSALHGKILGVASFVAVALSLWIAWTATSPKSDFRNPPSLTLFQASNPSQPFNTK